MERPGEPTYSGSSLEKNRLHTKKKTYGYIERDEQQRTGYLEYLKSFPPEDRVYLDEAGMDNREDSPFVWWPQGQRFEALKSGRRQQRVSCIAAICGQQLLAPFTFEGSCNRLLFEQWLEQYLLPVLKPGQVVILDNASFHKGGRIRELIEHKGSHLLYLPSYSPDLNPIERWWARMKPIARRLLESGKTLREAVDTAMCCLS